MRLFHALLVIGAALAAPSAAHAGWMEADKDPLDLVWITIAAIFVALMRLGFLFLEAGMVRSKNSINVEINNFADFIIAGL